MKDTIPDGYTRVTEVLSPFAKLDHIDPIVLENAADRGRRVHKYCESYALGLFVADVDNDCKHYFNAFKEWFDYSVVGVVHTEMRINSDKLKLTGAFDMSVLLKGDDGLTLIDIKTPQNASSTWQLQTAAYQMLAREEAQIDFKRRIALKLPRDPRRAQIVEYTDHLKDQELYLKALELYRFFKFS
jgi:hypothetical protein